MQVEVGIQLGDLKGIVRRRFKVVCGVALAVSLTAYWVAMALPNEYESYATVLVEPQSVDPDLVTAGIVGTDLNRRLHLMAAQILSRPRLSRVIDDLGLYEEESKYLTRDEIISILRSKIDVNPVMPELEQGRRVRNDSEIDRFQIRFHDDSATVARDLAQRLANDFIEQHIDSRVRVSQKSVEFIDEELSRLGDQIGAVETEMARIKAENAGRLPDDLAANRGGVERLLATVTAIRREVAEARSDEAFFRSQSATARELMRSAGGDRHDSPHARIRLLELQLTDHTSRGLTHKHPDMISVKKELALLQEQVEGESEEDSASGSFAEHSAAAEAERARNRRIAAESEIVRTEERIAEIQVLLAEIPRVAEQLDGLEREYTHLFKSYQDFSNRRLEATVQADLERRQLGEQFRVLENAFEATEPSSPNRLLIVAVGFLFGIAMGFGVGLVLEVADTSVHTARQLQTRIGAPVLGEIPQIWLESDRLGQRRVRLVTAAVTLGVIVFTLAGGYANYWWVNGSSRAQESVVEVEEVPREKAPAEAGEE